MPECPYCGGSLVHDYQKSQMTCSNCGRIVRERIKDRGPEWRSYDNDDRDRSRGGSPMTEDLHDRGLSTTIGPPTKDGKGKDIPPERRSSIGRQKTWDYRASMKGSRGEKLAFDRAKTVKSQMGLPRSTEQRACHLYRLASDRDMIRGKSIDGFLAAAFDVACRENPKVSRRLKDFADFLGVNPRKAKNAKKALISELSLTIPVPSLSKRVNELLGECYLPKDPIRDEAQKMVANAEKNFPPSYTGRNPSGVAAALVYEAFLKAGYPKSEKRIADMAGVSRTTVEEALDLLEEEGEKTESK